MKKIALLTVTLMFCITSLYANEVNVFSARHYDSDIQLYEKFTTKTGIKVNVVSGKDKALQKRITLLLTPVDWVHLMQLVCFKIQCLQK